MYSYDLTINSAQNWQAIVNTGEYCIVQLVRSTVSNRTDAPTVLRCRFGADSTSEGFNLRMDDTLIINTTLYVKILTPPIDGPVANYLVNVTVV